MAESKPLNRILLSVVLVFLVFIIPTNNANAGSNGQQVTINICYAKDFTIGGYNQNNELIYRVESGDPYGCVSRSVANFWWIGEITITANFHDGTSETQRVTIPKEGSDWIIVDFQRNFAVERGARWLRIDPDYSWSQYINIDNSIQVGTKDILYSPVSGYYRTDCSGFVSYAWALTDVQAPDTVALHFGRPDSTGVIRTYSIPVNAIDLQPGDIVINPEAGANGHVVLFVNWLDKSTYTFVGYDQYIWADYNMDGTIALIHEQGTRSLTYQLINVNGSQANLSAFYSAGYPTLLDGTWYADRKSVSQ